MKCCYTCLTGGRMDNIFLIKQDFEKLIENMVDDEYHTNFTQQKMRMMFDCIINDSCALASINKEYKKKGKVEKEDILAIYLSCVVGF